MSGSQDGEQWVAGTRLFREWADMKEEVLVHKWYESERAGRDIGWDRAFVDYMIRYGRKPSR